MKKVMRYIIGFVIAAVITALVISNTSCTGDDTTINSTVVYTCSTDGKCDNPKRKSPPPVCACVPACTCESKKYKCGKK